MKVKVREGFVVNLGLIKASSGDIIDVSQSDFEKISHQVELIPVKKSKEVIAS